MGNFKFNSFGNSKQNILLCDIDECYTCNKLKQTLVEIIRFFKEDEKFVRYSGCPVVLTKTALEEIKNILKENDIKINEVEDGNN